MKHFISGKQKGMTLLEVIVVLGVMGVISVGVVLIGERTIQNQQINKLNQYLNTIQLTMTITYNAKKHFPEATNDITSDQLTNSLILMGKISKSEFINPITGEPLRVYTTSNRGRANRSFAIKVGNISQDLCREVVNSTNESFKFIQIEQVGRFIIGDTYIEPDATAVSGVIKSPKGGENEFDIRNLLHLEQLCGGPAGGELLYDIFLGPT